MYWYLHVFVFLSPCTTLIHYLFYYCCFHNYFFDCFYNSYDCMHRFAMKDSEENILFEDQAGDVPVIKGLCTVIVIDIIITTTLSAPLPHYHPHPRRHPLEIGGEADLPLLLRPQVQQDFSHHFSDLHQS